MKKILIGVAVAAAMTAPAIAWDGYDWESGNAVEIDRGNLIERAEKIAEMIRRVHAGEPEKLARFEAAYSEAQTLYKTFGYGTATFGLGDSVD